MKGPELRAEKNRKKIIDAAIDQFCGYGIKKVSINDIALKAGVTTATVYNRFGNKEALVREAVKTWYTSSLDEYKEIMRTGSFEEKLQGIISFKSDMAGKIHGEFMLAASSDDPEIQRFLESDYMTEINRSVREFFDDGREQGYIDPALSTETIMQFAEIIRRGVNLDPDIVADPERNRKLLEQLMPLILYGIFGKQDKADNGN